MIVRVSCMASDEIIAVATAAMSEKEKNDELRERRGCDLIRQLFPSSIVGREFARLTCSASSEPPRVLGTRLVLVPPHNRNKSDQKGRERKRRERHKKAGKGNETDFGKKKRQERKMLLFLCLVGRNKSHMGVPDALHWMAMSGYSRRLRLREQQATRRQRSGWRVWTERRPERKSSSCCHLFCCRGVALVARRLSHFTQDLSSSQA